MFSLQVFYILIHEESMDGHEKNALFQNVLKEFLTPCKYRDTVFLGAYEGSRVMYKFLKNNDFFLKFGFLVWNNRHFYETDLKATVQV